jgi:hypothetical protein
MPAIPRPNKCLIRNLDTNEDIEAFVNPKEIGVDKAVRWNKHKSSKADNPVLEFTDGEPKDLQIELLFDTYEARTSVQALYIDKLDRFTKIIDETKKRPPMCIFLWGKNFPSFMGVIESLNVKYTMFLPDGTPVRATATLKMKQADKLTVGSKEGDKKKKGGAPVQDYTEARLATEADVSRPDLQGPNHRRTLDEAGSENGRLTKGQPISRAR